MFVIVLLRWLRGYAQIRVSQGCAGKLMTICARSGILLWNGRQQGEAYCCSVSIALLESLNALAGKAGIDVQVLGLHGLPHLLHRYRKRIGVLGGVALFLAVLVASQQFVWKVEVEGCKNVEPQRLIALLAESGVHRGTPKKNINLRFTAREILLKADELSWTTLNLHGTTAILRVRERTPPPPKVDTNVPANVVALEDGQIKKLQVTDGKAVLKEGETVRKGEVIVSGVWQDRWGLTHFVRAGAKAYAHVPKTLEVKIPLAQEFRIVTDVDRRNYFELFGFRLPLFFYRELQGEYKLETYSDVPSIFGVEMPFSIGHESAVFFERQESKITQEQALAIAQRRLEVLERQSFQDSPIITRNTGATVEDGVLILHGEYEIEMDIAEQKEIGLFEYSTSEDKKKILREGGY